MNRKGNNQSMPVCRNIMIASSLLCLLIAPACSVQPPQSISPVPSTLSSPSISNLANPEPNVLASGQPEATQIRQLARDGVEHVFDLRTDSESRGYDELALVTSLGMIYSRLPIGGAEDLTPANVDAFDQHLARHGDQKILVHCGSSNRVGAMAALRANWLQHKSPDEALSIGRAWGLTGLEPDVRALLRGESTSPDRP